MAKLVGRQKAMAARRRIVEREVTFQRVPVNLPSNYKVVPPCDNCGKPVDDGARWCVHCREAEIQ